MISACRCGSVITPSRLMYRKRSRRLSNWRCSSGIVSVTGPSPAQSAMYGVNGERSWLCAGPDRRISNRTVSMRYISTPREQGIVDHFQPHAPRCVDHVIERAHRPPGVGFNPRHGRVVADKRFRAALDRDFASIEIRERSLLEDPVESVERLLVLEN